MPARKSAPSPEIYQIKVTLLGTAPPIWRRLLVPAAITLRELSPILQVAMGWDGGHLHEFIVGQRRIGPIDRDMGIAAAENEAHVRLSEVVGRVGSKAIYLYDFGDSWEHSVVLEKRLPLDPEAQYPVCTDGALACPPEDCGGIPGYYNVVDGLGDPAHELYEEMIEAYGEEYDPQVFSVDEVNRHYRPARRGKK